MKVALVHDYIKEIGGAEKVFEILSDLYPQADIYTSLYCPRYFGPHRSRLEKKWSPRIHQSFFKFIPFAHKLLSPLRFLSPLAFKSFDFSHYDLIITSTTGAFFPNSLNKKSARLYCYCHTPPRYLYGLSTARDVSKYRFLNPVLQLLFHYYRIFDYLYAQNVDQFLTNSQTTAARIYKFYRRNAVVINPPYELPPPLSSATSRQSFYLTGGRFTFAKHFDLAIKACNHLKLPLKIFGRDFSGVEKYLRSIAGPTVEFLGEVSDSEKFNLYRQAQAYLFTSDDEDFGIMPVEAMACGCPVIAHRSGGVTETVIDGKTGLFFNNLTSESLSQAIQKFQKSKIKPSDCVSRAQDFSKDKFVKNLRKAILLS